MNTTSLTGLPELSAKLLAERTALRSFIQLLETEQGVLLSKQTEKLLPLSDKKNQAVHELSELITERRSKLTALGADAEPSKTEIWLRAHSSDILPVWRDIQQLGARARQLNQSNGELIQIGLRNNQQALNVLHNAAHSANGLYGPNGQPHMAISGRTLGTV